MRILVSLIAGGLFGAGLHLSGMTDTGKVQGFLDFFGNWDVTLAFVMAGAIAPMAVAWRVAGRTSPLLSAHFPARPDPAITRSLVVGAILFGMGWGLIGLCPGPAIASLSYGGWGGGLFLASMLTGMVLAPRARVMLDSASRLT